MKLSEFDYWLPKDLIAKYPLKERQMCRLMVLDRKNRSVVGKTFKDIIGYFNEGDLLVLNDTRVLPARIFGKRKTGGKVELFLLEKKSPICEALVRPSARVKEGEKIILESGIEAEILGKANVGRFVKFSNSIDEVLKFGHVPLPPYIDRPDEKSDKEDYQTVYSRNEGATASPTAGLHFTKDLLRSLSDKKIGLAYVTLHTSYGTFAPVKTEEVEEHKMHKECFNIPTETIEAVERAKKLGKSVIAIGTTSARSLEYWALTGKTQGDNDLFIYPGFKFKIIDHLITNFHLPESTLMLLVSAFAGREFILESYRKAVDEKYRFFSYGDAMLIL